MCAAHIILSVCVFLSPPIPSPPSPPLPSPPLPSPPLSPCSCVVRRLTWRTLLSRSKRCWSTSSGRGWTKSSRKRGMLGPSVCVHVHVILCVCVCVCVCEFVPTFLSCDLSLCLFHYHSVSSCPFLRCQPSRVRTFCLDQFFELTPNNHGL